MRDSLKISYKHQDEKGNIAGFFQFWEEAILETINTSIKILVEDTFQREEIIRKYFKSKHNTVRRASRVDSTS